MGNFNQEFIYFKIWDGVKDEKFYYHWGFTEKSNFLGGGVHEKPIYRGALPKKGEGAWTVCRFRGVAYRKRGELIPQCILWSHSISHEAYII